MERGGGWSGKAKERKKVQGYLFYKKTHLKKMTQVLFLFKKIGRTGFPSVF